MLDPYGFDGWVGPEPHGADPLRSGSSAAEGKQGRDPAISAQVVKLIQDPELARNLGRQAREYVVENLSLADMLKATREFYEEVQAQLIERTLESTPRR